MRSIFILTTVLITLSSFAQTNSTISQDSISAFYILDETWRPNSAKRFETDNSPNYLQVQDGYAIICSRSRNNSLFIEGEVDGLEVTQEGRDKVISFYIRGRNWAVGKLLSVEIIKKETGETVIHVYRKLGTYDTYYSAHPAFKSEKNEILKYWNE